MAVASLGTIRQAADNGSMVFVPGGRFFVGAAAPRAEGWPPREAEVRPLRISRCPVTNGEYAAFLAAGGAAEPPWWKDPDFWDAAQPVVGVSWLEAVAYCVWLGEKLGGRWRLPTEAEWEHAACAANAQDARTVPMERPRRVGQGEANAYGLMDVGTLVHEWCCDWFAPDDREARRYDPRGPEHGEKRVRRGGGWRAEEPTLSFRDGFDPRGHAMDGGFRVVREVP